MKRICILLIMIALTALGANAQTVTGSGTTNTIPKFTSSSTIGDSQIRQINDNIGINTDFIVGRLSVFESRENGINFPTICCVRKYIERHDLRGWGTRRCVRNHG